MDNNRTRPKTGGRLKGTPNRITATLKFQLSQVLTSEYDRIPELLDKLTPTQRLNIVVRLSQFILPDPSNGLDQFDMVRTNGLGDWNYRPATVDDYIEADPEPNC
jgi:hypothetical protein